MVSEYLREVKEFWGKFAIVLGVVQQRGPLVSERKENAVWVVQAIVYLDEVVSERLHPDQEREGEKSG